LVCYLPLDWQRKQLHGYKGPAHNCKSETLGNQKHHLIPFGKRGISRAEVTEGAVQPKGKGCTDTTLEQDEALKQCATFRPSVTMRCRSIL